ncbi:MAG: hypothetical protein HY843_08700, partial [Bdellovibrio sp.]|nr:hypothetical protein [Bdellovibrio sp.]
IGPDKVPYVFILCSILGPLTTLLLSTLFKKTGKYTNVLVAYHLGLLIFFLGTYATSIFGFGRPVAWSYFIATQINRLIYPVVLWSLLGNYFNVFDAKRLFPLLASIGEMGSILADVLIWKFFFSYRTSFFLLCCVATSVGVLLVLLPFYRQRAVKYSGITATGESEDHPKLNILKESLVLKLIMVVALFTIVGTAVIYQFNCVVKAHYGSVSEINKFFALYGVLCSLSVIAFSFAFSTWVLPVVQVVTLQGFVAAIMLLAVGGAFVFPVLAAFVFADFLRNLLKHTIYQASYEQITGGLVTNISFAIKSFTQGLVSPLITFLTGLFLLAFPNQENFRLLSFILMTISAFWVFLTLRMRMEYLRFHLDRLLSHDSETVVRSIQALGEKGNLPAVHALLNMLSESSSVIIKKYTIHSLGNIRATEVMRILFQQIYTENEVIQQTAIRSISNYDSFVAQRFLMDFLNGRYCKSLLVRESLIRVLHRVIGSGLIPVLLPFLENNDPRVVANTIESMSETKDLRVIEVLLPFLKNPNNRIRANTVMVLYKFHETRSECEKTLEGLGNDQEETSFLSFIYVVGKLKLRKYLPRLHEISKNPQGRVKVNLAYAYSSLGIDRGYHLFSEIFASSESLGSLHHFLQLQPAIRLRIIECFLSTKPNHEILNYLLTAINKSQFDFYDEVEILEEYLQADQKRQI